MAKPILIITPEIKVPKKDIRELSETYVILRCLPSQAYVMPATGIDPRVIHAGLAMLGSNDAFVDPVRWRAWLAEQFVTDAKKASGGGAA
jgi:hypothetical protein